MKRYISALLALVMLLSLAPTAARRLRIRLRYLSIARLRATMHRKVFSVLREES